MNIAVVLSGSIRMPERTLAFLDSLQGHDVSTFIHTWTDIEKIKHESFSHQENVEPSWDLISKFNPRSICFDSWEVMRSVFHRQMKLFASMDHIPDHTANVGMEGMFWSMCRACDELIPSIHKYDLAIRMRFGCDIRQRILSTPRANGWVIPEGNDFFGLNDQLAWFWTYPEDAPRSRREASCYLRVYNDLEAIIRSGVGHGPEAVLKANFDRMNVPATRVPFDYSIYR